MAIKKKRIKLKKFPIIMLVIFILLVVYFCYTHTNKYLFIKGINNAYKNIVNDYNTFVDKYLYYINDDYHSKTDTSISIKTSSLDRSIAISGDSYLADENNYFDLGIAIDKSSYKLQMLSKKNELFYRIDNSNYYKIKVKSINTLNSNVIPKIISNIISVSKSNLKNASFSKKYEKIVINSKDYKTKKITLNISNNDYLKIMREFYQKMKSDDELLDYFMIINNYKSRTELQSHLDDLIELYDYKLKNDSNKEIVCKYSIYFYNSKPIKNEIELLTNVNYKVSYIDYKNYFELNYSESDKYNSHVIINDKKIDIFIDGIGYGKGSYDDDSFDIGFSDYDKDSLGYIKYSYSNNKANIDFLIDLDGLDLAIKSQNAIDDKKTPKVNLDKSMDSNKMVSSDREKMLKILSSLKEIFPF